MNKRPQNFEPRKTFRVVRWSFLFFFQCFPADISSLAPLLHTNREIYYSRYFVTSYSPQTCLHYHYYFFVLASNVIFVSVLLNTEVPHSLQGRLASDFKRAWRVHHSKQPRTSREGATVNGQVIMERRLVGIGVGGSSSWSQVRPPLSWTRMRWVHSNILKREDFPCYPQEIVIVVFCVVHILLLSKLRENLLCCE